MTLFKARYADGQVIEFDGLAVRLRVSGRARRVSLRIDRASGEAEAIAPSRSQLADAARFARERRDWLDAQMRRVPAPAELPKAGDTLRVLGEPWRLVADGRRPRLHLPQDGTRRLSGCGVGTVDPMLVARAIRREALEAFTARAERHCERLGVGRPPIRLIDARTRWGSCTPAQGGRAASIRLSWRLALAPFEVADYVVAHECAHLLEANHGPRFWSHVRTLVGDPAPCRRWLHAEGPGLHGLLTPG